MFIYIFFFCTLFAWLASIVSKKSGLNIIVTAGQQIKGSAIGYLIMQPIRLPGVSSLQKKKLQVLANYTVNLKGDIIYSQNH